MDHPMKIHPLCRSWVFPKQIGTKWTVTLPPKYRGSVLNLLKQKSLICIVFCVFSRKKHVLMFGVCCETEFVPRFCQKSSRFLFLCYCFALVSKGLCFLVLVEQFGKSSMNSRYDPRREDKGLCFEKIMGENITVVHTHGVYWALVFFWENLLWTMIYRLKHVLEWLCQEWG